MNTSSRSQRRIPIVAAIEKIETKITELEKQITDIPKQKEKTLRKYLVLQGK